MISPTRKKAENALVHMALNRYVGYSLTHTVEVGCKTMRRIERVMGIRVSKRDPPFQHFKHPKDLGQWWAGTPARR